MSDLGLNVGIKNKVSVVNFSSSDNIYPQVGHLLHKKKLIMNLAFSHILGLVSVRVKTSG